MLGHGAAGVGLDYEVDTALLIYVADGRVGSDDGLLHLRALVLGDDGGFLVLAYISRLVKSTHTSNRQTALHVLFGQLEAELLSVVVDNLGLF